MSEGEVPWPSGDTDAQLIWQGDYGYLHFYDPKGHRAVVPVTRGPEEGGRPVWHVEEADGVATVSPSTHYVGHWHSPNPVRFRLIPKLPGAPDLP